MVADKAAEDCGRQLVFLTLKIVAASQHQGARSLRRGRELAIERIEDVREVEHELVIYAFEVDL